MKMSMSSRNTHWRMAAEMAAEVGYVALPAESYEAALTTLEGLK